MSMPAAAPSGTVTFLFTDVEETVTAREQAPDAVGGEISRHEQVIRKAINDNGGYAYKTVGNGLQAAFSTAPQAVRAAIEALVVANSEEQGGGAARVRMALHTGVTEERGDDYFGPLLNRAARLLAAGHGGQVLLSQTTALLAQDNLPGGVALKDLGEHRLKDLFRPERIYQLAAPELGLLAEFPPLKTLETRPNNLPLQPTPFLGRDREAAEVRDVLCREDVFLLTLTGPGGIGKTRLALQVAADLLDEFKDGVFFVPLAAVSNPALVMPAVNHAVGLQEVSGQSMLETLSDYLRDKQMLLVLDNFEQVMDAGTEVADLLMSAPRLKVLVTSRASLHLSMQHEYPVLPLQVPDPNTTRAATPETLSQYESVQLFIERAQAVRPDFQVNNQNAPAVAEICCRLEGIPLAIELAAARIKTLNPQAMLERLGNRLKLLTGGGRDLHLRQQTLRNTIEWSYELLNEGEQQLFRRVAVFSRGCTLEAAEAVCGGEPDIETGSLLPLDIDVLDGITSLVDRSLMYTSEEGAGQDQPRYLMLETISEYAWQKLSESNEAEAMNQRHALYFMEVAEAAEPELTGSRQTEWLDRLESDHDNLRSCLRWAREGTERGDTKVEGTHGETDAVTIGLRIAGAIWRFWIVRGYVSEGREHLAALLQVDADLASDASQAERPPESRRYRAKALTGEGLLAYLQGDYSTARSLHEESLALYRELEDKAGISTALNSLGIVAYDQGDYTQARAMHEESLVLKRELGEKRGIINSLTNLGNVIEAQGDMESARAVMEESLALARDMGDKWSICTTLINLGTVAQAQGDYSYARTILEESLAVAQELGDRHGIATTYTNLGIVAHDQGDFVTARSLHEQGLALKEELGDKRGIAISRTNLGQIAAAQGEHDSARDLFAHSLTLQGEIGDKWGAAASLSGLAGLAVAHNDKGDAKPQRAARLLGAVDALLKSMGAKVEGSDRQHYERTLDSARTQLGEEAFSQAWDEGRAMSLDEAITYALGDQ